MLGLKSGLNNPESLESPDLGPPPIAHFEEEEPIKFDPDRKPPIDRTRESMGDDDLPVLPANLETRKKRRDSSLIRPFADADSASEPQRNKDIVPGPSLRAGAKRKLNMLDESNKADPAPVLMKDDFLFSRKGGTLETSSELSDGLQSSTSKGVEYIQQTDSAKKKQVSHKTIASARRVLEPSK